MSPDPVLLVCCHLYACRIFLAFIQTISETDLFSVTYATNLTSLESRIIAAVSTPACGKKVSQTLQIFQIERKS
jgi:hypothetical protein